MLLVSTVVWKYDVQSAEPDLVVNALAIRGLDFEATWKWYL